MTDHDDITVSHQAGLSRRSLLGGLTATAGAVSLATIAGTHAASAANVPAFAGTPNGEIDALLDPTIAGLVYLPLDAFAFDTATVGATPYRLYQEVTGMQPSSPAEYIYASLPITIGAVVKQINVAYQGQPIISISRRTLGGAFVDVTTPTSLAAGGGAKTQSLNVTADLTAGATYCVRVFCSAGDSILGMTIGYIPAAQAFIAYTGSQSPRVFDSRPFAKFAANEERVIDLSSRLISTARAAVVNLTAAETAGAGFLAAFTDGIAWPGNSSVNFNGPDQSAANGVLVAMTAGRIKVRCGPNASHVIVDVIGSLL